MVQLAFKTDGASIGSAIVAGRPRPALAWDGDLDVGRRDDLRAEGLFSPLTFPDRRGGMAPWQVKRIWTYIDTHLAEHISLPIAALQVRLSASYFSRVFKLSFGESFKRFVRRKRVERAQVLMATTKLRLCDVACATGFSDQSHLSRAFLQSTGFTPSDWRRRALACSPHSLARARSATPIYPT